MRTNILMLFAVLSFILLSCESKDKWINQHDSQADMGDSAKICKQVDVECGKKWVNYSGVDLEINCGECSDGYECRYNTCWDIDECENPDLNNCPEHSTCANEEGSYSCICDDNYTWINSECVEKPQEEPNTDDSGDSTPADSDTSDSTDDSDSAPDNSDSTPDDDTDTSDSIDDSSDSESDDAPDTDSIKPTEEECNALGGTWASDECTRISNCSSKPDNTEWNTVDAITQIYTSSGWEPSTTPIYNETQSESECRYKCASGYVWNNSSCITPPECSASSGTPCKDSSSGLTWSAKSNFIVYNKAVNYCDSHSEGGLSGWRLPTISELRTLIQDCPATQIPPVGDNICRVREDNNVTCLSESSCRDKNCYSCAGSNGGHSKFGDTGDYCSSSTNSDNTDFVWAVFFREGYVSCIEKTAAGYVRCVR